MSGTNNGPRGGLITWQGPSASGRYSAKRLDRSALISIERFIGSCLSGFMDSHPCIGARLLGSDKSFYYSVYKDMYSIESACYLLDDIKAYYAKSDNINIVKTMLCIFTDPINSKEDFSTRFWKFMQLVVDIDSLQHPYDSTISSDPADQNFELSFCGRAAFPTTIHPAHDRTARRFAYPGWALNQSSQFGALRADGSFEDWQRKIRAADAAIDPSGQPNPLLVDHGDGSAASQLGQVVLPEYPFQYGGRDNVNQTRERLIQKAIIENASEKTIAFFEVIISCKI